MLRPAALLLVLVAAAAVSAHLEHPHHGQPQLGLPQYRPQFGQPLLPLGPPPPKKGIVQKVKDAIGSAAFKAKSALYDARVKVAESILPHTPPPTPKLHGVGPKPIEIRPRHF